MTRRFVEQSPISFHEFRPSGSFFKPIVWGDVLMAQSKTSSKVSKKSASRIKAAPAKKSIPAKKATHPAAKKAKAPAESILKSKTKEKLNVAKVVSKKASAPIASERPAKKEKPPAPRSKADLNYFRDLLLEKRREILGDVGSMESEAFKGGSNLSNMPIHMADVGTDNFEQEFTLGLIESERQMLRQIQEALVRIDAGTFGICQGTGKGIPRVRLEAVPWAKYTIEYSRLLESGKLSRDNGHASEEESSSDDDDE